MIPICGNCQCFIATLTAQFKLCWSVLIFYFLFVHSLCVGKIRKRACLFTTFCRPCEGLKPLDLACYIKQPSTWNRVWRGVMSMRRGSCELSLTHRWVTQHRAPISCLVFTCRVLFAHNTPPYTWIRGLLVTGSVVLLLYTANGHPPALYLAQTCLCAMHRHTDRPKKATQPTSSSLHNSIGVCNCQSSSLDYNNLKIKHWLPSSFGI